MSSTKFTVTNTLATSTGQNVLVFTVPTLANSNYTFSAWQNLNISPGGSQPFVFDITLAVKAVNPLNGSTSPLVPVDNGTVLLATYDNVKGIGLAPSSADDDLSRITSGQVGVINRTDSNNPIMLATEWYINGNPAVRINNMNYDSVGTFELQPSLYFFAAIPTQQGFNYTYQLVSKQTAYDIPANTKEVSVKWYREGNAAGADLFLFDPLSA